MNVSENNRIRRKAVRCEVHLLKAMPLLKFQHVFSFSSEDPVSYLQLLCKCSMTDALRSPCVLQPCIKQLSAQLFHIPSCVYGVCVFSAFRHLLRHTWCCILHFFFSFFLMWLPTLACGSKSAMVGFFTPLQAFFPFDLG